MKRCTNWSRASADFMNLYWIFNCMPDMWDGLILLCPVSRSICWWTEWWIIETRHARTVLMCINQWVIMGVEVGKWGRNLPFLFTPTPPYYGLLGHQDWRTMQIGIVNSLHQRNRGDFGLCFCGRTSGHLRNRRPYSKQVPKSLQSILFRKLPFSRDWWGSSDN